MNTTASRAPVGTTLLDLLWQLQGAEELSEEQLVETILALLAEGRIRLRHLPRHPGGGDGSHRARRLIPA